MAYCDTNILTAFVNKNQLGKRFGKKSINRYPNIKGLRDKNVESKLRNINKCKISKKALLNDLRGHQASMGAVLTSINLKEVDIVDVDGFKKGKRFFNDLCSKEDPNLKNFKDNFCYNKKLKKNLKRNQIEDIRHIGSSMELGEKEFITGDKDLNSINKYRGLKRKNL